MKAYSSQDVYSSSLERLEQVYKQGHRVIVAFSAGNVSWEKMTVNMYHGDPFLLSTAFMGIGYVEPEQFRSGSGVWVGKPVW